MTTQSYRLYKQESYIAKRNAQLNLAGRTHYVDDDTLAYFRARILSAGDSCQGRLFYLIESVSLDPDHTRRGFRGVVFDIMGTVIERPKMEDAYRSREAARKAMYTAINAMDVDKITAEAIDREERHVADELARLREAVAQKEEAA